MPSSRRSCVHFGCSTQRSIPSLGLLSGPCCRQRLGCRLPGDQLCGGWTRVKPAAWIDSHHGCQSPGPSAPLPAGPIRTRNSLEDFADRNVGETPSARLNFFDDRGAFSSYQARPQNYSLALSQGHCGYRGKPSSRRCQPQCRTRTWRGPFQGACGWRGCLAAASALGIADHLRPYRNLALR